MKRVYEHRTDIIQGLTKKYSIHKLVYYEQTNDIYNAIEREKHLKKWHRKWKIKLIEKFDPNWDDLYDEVTG
jgi:putative endonuclease